ncbi:MAG: L,D-transpeptidase family protein [Spartobacteria bacterium]
MRLPPLPRACLLLAFLGAIFSTSCTELPNDIGVHPHRSVAAQTRAASLHPVFASWDDDPAAEGPGRIVINLTTQQAFFYRGATFIGRTNISSGRRDFETPPGKYRVIQKDADHVSSQYGQYVTRSGAVLRRDADVGRDPLPRGARFVGAPMPYFLRFTGGYGMHAGFVPRYRASHGCIRMPMRMAKHFFDAAEIGTRVEVIEPPAMVDR